MKGRESITGLADDLDNVAKVLDGDMKAAAQAAAAQLRGLAQQDAAINAFNALDLEARAAAKALKAAETEAANYAAQVGRGALMTKQEADGLVQLQAQVKAAKDAYNQSSAALKTAQAELTRYGISAKDAGAAQQRLRTQVASVRDAVQGLSPDYQKAAAGATAAEKTMERTHRAVGDGVKSISKQLSMLQGLFAAVAGASQFKQIATDLAQTADQANNLQARIKLAAGEGEAFAMAWQGVQDVALRTHSALEETGALFTRLAQTGKDAGLSTRQAIEQSLALTETINQTVQLSGASAAASSAAITQLVQGLQSGVLRGDEFNSVMEQAPRLARALADGLGVTTGELRKMAEAGALTADTVIKALKGQSDVVAREFQKLPPTVGRALQDLSTQWTLYVAEVDKSTGASAAAAKAIEALANHLRSIAGLLIDVGQAAAAFIALRLAQQFLGIGAAAKVAAAEVAASSASMNAATAAANAAGAAAGRLATVLRGLRTFTLVGIVANFKDIGTWIGEAAAKLAGYKDLSEDIARADRLAAEIAKEAAQDRARLAAATQLAIEKQYDLSKAARLAVDEFEKLTKEGNSAAQAVKKITEGFDLSKVQGIKDFTTVLGKLAADGKITAGEVQQAWSDALKGIDLGRFEVVARQAFLQVQATAEKAAKAVRDAMARGVTGDELKSLQDKAREAAAEVDRASTRMQQALDAGVREAVRRTGLDWDVLAGKIGKASVSAINDVQALQDGIQTLKAEGIDVGHVLTVSLSKAIQTADSQAAIDALKAKINELRGELGEKIADGLLDQAKKRAEELSDALDAATPGINSVREAFKSLGIKSDGELKQLAKTAKESFDVIKASGTSSPREINEAWKKMAEAAIAANDGVADASIKAQAQAHGFAVETDAAGKSVVKSLGEAKGAAKGVGDALGKAGEEGRDALGKIDYGAQMAGKSLEELEKITRQNWDAQRDLADQAAETNAAANEAGNAWRKEQQAQNKYYGEMLKLLQKTRMGVDELNKAAWAGANSLEALDKQQQAIERSSSDAASGLAQLEDQLAELNGSEEIVEQRRTERSKAEVARKMALLALDIQRAQIRKDHDEQAALEAEMAAYQKQLVLIDEISRKEREQRKENARAAAQAEREQNQRTHSERMGQIDTEAGARQAAIEDVADAERKAAEDALRARQKADDEALKQRRAAEDKAAKERFDAQKKALDDAEASRQAREVAAAEALAARRKAEDERAARAEAARKAREAQERAAAAAAAQQQEQQRQAREAAQQDKPGNRSQAELAAQERQREAVLAAQQKQAEEQARLEAERAEAAAVARAKRLADERAAEDKATAAREKAAQEAHQKRLKELEAAEQQRQARLQAEREREDASVAAQREREEALLKAMQDVAAAVVAVAQKAVATLPGMPGMVGNGPGAGATGVRTDVGFGTGASGAGGAGISTGTGTGAPGRAPVPHQPAAPIAISYVTLPGGKTERIGFDSLASQAKATDLLRQLAAARGAAL